MPYVSMKQMLETGVHFGHQTRRWNPKMRPFIFGARKGIHIIDLQQTVKLYRKAHDFIADTVAREEKALIAMTKVGNEDHPMYGTNGGKDTEDWVFLLSIGEAERYFEDDEDRRTFPTEYAIARDAYVYSDLGTVWW